MEACDFACNSSHAAGRHGAGRSVVATRLLSWLDAGRPSATAVVGRSVVAPW